MMPFDRGRIKWTSLYLPEHKKLIAKMYEDEDDEEMPILEEQRLEQLQEVAAEAIAENRPVQVTYYEDKRIKKFEGMIKMDAVMQIICIKGHNGSKLNLSITSVLDIKCLDDDV